MTYHTICHSENASTNINEPTFSITSHSFNEGVAIQTKSVIAATIFNHLFFWLKHNKSKGMHQHEGRTWMYEKISDIAVHFSYLSEQQIKDHLAILVKFGYILKGKFSKNKFDHTNWYAVANEDWLGFQKSFTKGSTDPIQSVPGPEPAVPQTRTYKDTDNINTYNETHIELARTTASPRSSCSEISFSFEKRKFENITDSDIKEWKELYGGVDVVREMREMVQWILANPKKKKKQWRKFILNWLQVQYEKTTNKAAVKSLKQNEALERHQVNTKYWGGEEKVKPKNCLDFSEDV